MRRAVRGAPTRMYKARCVAAVRGIFRADTHVNSQPAKSIETCVGRCPAPVPVAVPACISPVLRRLPGHLGLVARLRHHDCVGEEGGKGS